ncbi:MAG: STAS/SEC14 domain-containing protein [Alphaproteobacteria bacterium]|nr:STAS/SEC14 domain-containing protein [Alphaproteobacteria bacterium]
MSRTVITLPGTSETTLCLQLTGLISADDFTTYFDVPVQQAVEKHGFYNLYIYYDPQFEGWSREAADLSFKCISQYSPKARRLAYINAPDSRMLMMKMLSPMMQAEIQYFTETQKDEALQWVLSYQP